MRPDKRRFFIVAASVVVAMTLLFFGARIFIFHKINVALKTQAALLRGKGIIVSFDSVETNSFRNLISVRNISIKFPSDSASCNDSANFVSLKRAEVQGISFLPFIFEKKVKIKSVTFSSPLIRISKPRAQKKKSPKPAPGKKPPIEEIALDHLAINFATVVQYDSSSCEATAKIETADIDLSGIRVSDVGLETMRFLFDRLTVSGAKVKLPKAFYTLSLLKMEWNGRTHEVQLDSFRVTPDYNRTIFAQKHKTQIDRIECVVPAIRAMGADPEISATPRLHIQHIETGFTLSVFHDKRFPGGKPRIKLLPSAAIHSIASDIQIDSISLSNTDITYEEFPQEGTEAGLVSFNKLNATIKNFSTRSADPMTMSASARFMNAGNLKANFSVPADPKKPYYLNGLVTDMNLTTLNKILIPIAHVEVRSGNLHELKFDYTYNEYRADGELKMSYSKLDVASLVKNGKKGDVNKLLTLVIHAFVKKDMDKNTDKGKILYYHDPDRSTFNYWWKSILSGVKTLFGLDKIMDTTHSKKK